MDPWEIITISLENPGKLSKSSRHGLSRSVTRFSDNVWYLSSKIAYCHGSSRFVTVRHAPICPVPPSLRLPVDMYFPVFEDLRLLE